MTRINVPPPDHLPEIRDGLSRGYDDAYEAWTRQDLLVDAIRTGNAGPGDEADHATTHAQLEEQIALADRLRSHLDDLGVAIERTDTRHLWPLRRLRTRHPPTRRLKLFPAAIYCVACKQQLEQR
jgi:RNA polymerase-binding transcription factor DksA